ncbi:MAG: hypothetical protein ACK452_15820, partial [Bacteroidota bacterium]
YNGSVKKIFSILRNRGWNNLFKPFNVGHQIRPVEKLKFNYTESGGFFRLEKFLEENKINFSVNRNYNEP